MLGPVSWKGLLAADLGPHSGLAVGRADEQHTAGVHVEFTDLMGDGTLWGAFVRLRGTAGSAPGLR